MFEDPFDSGLLEFWGLINCRWLNNRLSYNVYLLGLAYPPKLPTTSFTRDQMLSFISASLRPNVHIISTLRNFRLLRSGAHIFCHYRGRRAGRRSRVATPERHAKSVGKNSISVCSISDRSTTKSTIFSTWELTGESTSFCWLRRGMILTRCLLEVFFPKGFLLSTEQDPELTMSPSTVIMEASL